MRLVKRIAIASGIFIAALLFLLALRLSRQASTGQESPVGRTADELVELAEQASREGYDRRARKFVQEALGVDPLHGRGRLYEALFLHEDHASEAALAALARIPEDDGLTGGTARHLEGRILLDEKRAAQAEQRFLRATALNRRYAVPVRELMQLYAIQLREIDTRQMLERLEQLRPLTLEELVIALLAGRPILDEPQAIRQLEEFIAQDPGDTASLAALIRYALLSGDMDQATRRIESARLLTGGKLSADLRGLAALVSLAQNDLSSVVEVLSELPVDERSPLVFWELRGQLALAQNDFDTARHVFAYLTAICPYSIADSHALATAYERSQSDAEARNQHVRTQLLDQLERLAYMMQRPQSKSPQLVIPVIQEIAEILEQLGHRNAAANWLRAGLDINPQHQSFRDRIRELQNSPVVSESTAVSVPVLPEVSQLPHLLPSRSTVDRDGQRIPAGEAGAPFQLVDTGVESGIDFEYFNGRSSNRRIVETVGGGAAVLDFDADGWPDLYFPQGAHDPHDPTFRMLNDRIYRNLRGLKYVERTVEVGVDDEAHSLGCAVGDVDNDGFADLMVANLGRNTLYQNQGDGTFRVVADFDAGALEEFSSAAAFGDLDGDGLLDLYIVNYVQEWERICINSRGVPATCDPREFAGGQDRLLWNNGQGEFVDVSESASVLRSTDDGKGLGVILADLNQDGQLDVYVANDGTPNFLFWNRSESGNLRFEEAAMSAGAAVDWQGRSQAGMGIAAADFDQNGTLDLFVTNFYRESNTLYLNLGHGLFDDRTRAARLDVPSRDVLGFGTQALDLDLNGTADLIVLNGDIDDYSAFGRPWKMKPQVFRNNGSGRFADVSRESGEFFQQPGIGRGLARLDFNRDGAPDVVAVFHDQRAVLLENAVLGRSSGVESSNFVSLRLIDTVGCRDAIGASVVAEFGDQKTAHWVISGDGFASANERLLTIGLGATNQIDSLTVIWPTGTRTRLLQVLAGQHLIVLNRDDSSGGVWAVAD